MRVLVTGSSGFIGRHLVETLLQAGCEVKGIDIVRPERQDDVYGFDFEVCDIRHSNRLTRLLKRWSPSAIIHLAARTDLKGMDLTDYSANIAGVRNLIQAIRETPSVKRCIVTSSQLVCKIGYIPADSQDYCPTTLYGKSKVLTEMITKETDGGGVVWCIVRPTTIWGPGMSQHYQRFFRAVARDLYFHVGQKPLRKSYGYVKNTAHQYLMLINTPDEQVHQQTFYLADYDPLSLREWVDAIQQKLGVRPVKTLPEPLAWSIAKIGDIVNATRILSSPFDSFRLRNILTEYQFDLSNTKRVCGSLPYTMSEGIDETVEWLKSEVLVA